MKLKSENFGSGILTNVSHSICEEGYAPHIDYLNTNILMVINAPSKRVVVSDSKLCIKKILNITLTMDMRVSSLIDISTTIDTVKEVFNNPKKFL